VNDLADPTHLLKRIVGIFPEFTAYWEADHPGEASGLQTAHSVYMSLSPFVHSATLTAKQLSAFAALLNESVAAGGSSENAVATCFLEHLGPSPLRKALWPLLLTSTKARTHA
jgi:hypothetical protein